MYAGSTMLVGAYKSLDLAPKGRDGTRKTVQ